MTNELKEMKQERNYAYKLNGKHIVEEEKIQNKKKVYTVVIKQAIFNFKHQQGSHQNELNQNIQRSICDSQNLIYYSIYLVKQKYAEFKYIEKELSKLDVDKILSLLGNGDKQKLDPVKYLQKLNEEQLKKLNVPETLQVLIQQSPKQLDLVQYLDKLEPEELLKLDVPQILQKWIKGDRNWFVLIKCLQKLNKDESFKLGIPKIIQKWIKNDPSMFDLANYFEKMNDQQLQKLDASITIKNLIKDDPQKLNLFKYLQKLNEDELSNLEVPKIFQKRNKNDQQNLNKDESLKKRRTNITFSQYCFVDRKFFQKLSDFQFLQRKIIEKNGLMAKRSKLESAYIPG
ncbi:unnamed protein product (macronuclear) [Paramecium tetraurelia]|uniref:Uncharacterized protein n=1 Tax=Paramecium tetraurelia TaxID=5888 RepID=A0CIT9_PARTE|nr:uncharacterized protein GSPATT00007841001 [Paramecium tetraurelia]CAK70706.1 unnamed protein product [Paramecium tetraurelia]|eukprot:XP_001438103.1 hypothetical protein (macronuclear) [Paramecium tetraurelia strain d4-2]